MTSLVLDVPAPRSRFVSVIAWLGIASGAATTIGAASTLLVHLAFQPIAALAGGVMALVAAFGLRRRLEWARQGFIIVQAYAMVNLVVAAAFVLRVHVPGRTASVATFVRVQMLVTLVGFAAANGWIIAKLRSRKVRAEFDVLD